MMVQKESSFPAADLDPQEIQAIQQLKEGDIAGLEYLVKKYQLLAVRTAVLITCERSLAEDVVQDAFLRSYHRIHQFNARRRFGPWFIKSVANAALRTAQKRSRTARLDPTEIDLYHAEGQSTGRSPEITLERAETNQEIWAALKNLKPRRRSLLVQRYFAGLKVKDIAHHSGQPLGTIKWQLSKARQQLKGALIFNRTLVPDQTEGAEK